MKEKQEQNKEAICTDPYGYFCGLHEEHKGTGYPYYHKLYMKNVEEVSKMLQTTEDPLLKKLMESCVNNEEEYNGANALNRYIGDIPEITETYVDRAYLLGKGILKGFNFGIRRERDESTDSPVFKFYDGGLPRHWTLDKNKSLKGSNGIIVQKKLFEAFQNSTTKTPILEDEFNKVFAFFNEFVSYITPDLSTPTRNHTYKFIRIHT
eukprot:GHVR01133814.1.p1 GENE.GHVR01133814.1~~GHVR01133814.1.p1  ORF type:complete len:208 (+),score=21.55 GHVR01133814.1:858-1481(+)